MSQNIFEKGNYISVVDYDPVPENPRKFYETLGVIYYNSNHYTLGDEIKSKEDMDIICSNPNIVSFPVYALIHSNIKLSLSPYHDMFDYDMFDSGQSGVYCVEQDILEKILESPYDENNFEHVERIKVIIQSELEEFSSYLNGEVYHVTTYEKKKDLPDNFKEMDIKTLAALGFLEEVEDIYGVYDESMEDAAYHVLSGFAGEEETELQFRPC